MRLSLLDEDPTRVETVAKLLATGATREKVCEVMGITDLKTVTEWRKRPDVQAAITKVIRERENRVLSLTDTQIVKKLEALGDKIDLETLLKVRREFAGATINLKDGDQAGALEELVAAMHKNPALALAVQGAVAGDADSGSDD